MKSTPYMILILLLICGIAAGSLALVNAATRDQIEEFARTEKAQALKHVFQGADDFKELLPGRQWEALKGGERAGYVFAATIQGYSGRILSFFGLDAANTVTGAKVLSQTETPGLGVKIAGEKFLKQFQGKSREEVALKKDDPAGQIDAITAATISSRALTTSIRRTIEEFLKGDLK